MSRDTAFTTACYAGWLMLAAAIAQWRILEVPLMMFSLKTSTGILVSLITYPIWICAVIGAIGLIRGRTWGFYLVYASLTLSIFGWKVPFLPLVKLLLPKENWGWIMFTINLFVVALLAFCHYTIRHTKDEGT